MRLVTGISIALLAVLVALMVACTPESAVVNPVVQTIDPEHVELEQLMLLPQDMKDINEVVYITTTWSQLSDIKDIARYPAAYNLDDSDEALQLLESWGRIRGIRRGFTDATNEQRIYLSCAVYNSVEGASKAFTHIDNNKSFNKTRVENNGGSEFTFSQLDNRNVGDATQAYKYSFLSSDPEVQGIRQHVVHFKFHAQFVLCNYQWYSYGGIPILSDELEAMASRGYEKIMDELTLVDNPRDSNSYRMPPSDF